MRTQILTLVLGLIACGTCFAHTDHSHEPQSELTDSAWEARLSQFQTTGAAVDLAAAEYIAAELLQRETITPARLYLAARTAQAGHRFELAERHLSTLLTRVPQHLPARLLMSTLMLVRGDIAGARAACAKIRNANPLVMITCFAQAEHAPKPQLLKRLSTLVDSGHFESTPAAIRAWALATVGDVAVRLGRDDEAVQRYQAAMTLSPAVRYTSAMIDSLLRLQRFDEAHELVAMTPAALGLQVKQLLVLKRLDRLAAGDPRVRRLERSFEHDRRHGDFTHGREMAEFYLDVLNDPARAQQVIDGYAHIQREYEDLLLAQRVSRAIART